jgi:outer membrane protein assembly factor BamB
VQPTCLFPLRRRLRFEPLEDRRLLSVDLVSKAAFPSYSAGGSTTSVLSANGRYVAFASNETLTGIGTTPGLQNIYRFDRDTGELVLVSVNSAGTGSGNGTSGGPAISADGNVVVFQSSASNLHPLDTDSGSDVFARNLATGTTYLVSVNSASTGSGNGTSDGPVVSADGNVVAFYSTSSNLHPLDTVTGTDVFARNLAN